MWEQHLTRISQARFKNNRLFSRFSNPRTFEIMALIISGFILSKLSLSSKYFLHKNTAASWESSDFESYIPDKKYSIPFKKSISGTEFKYS